MDTAALLRRVPVNVAVADRERTEVDEDAAAVARGGLALAVPAADRDAADRGRRLSDRLRSQHAREAAAVDDRRPRARARERVALEQQLAARPGEAGSPRRPVGDREADVADVLEQEADVPVDDDDVPL
jgi:hypothetical protein